MATKKKLLQAAAGSAGGGEALNVEQLFSTYVYGGNGVGNSINNELNLGDDTEERVLLNLSGDDSTDSGPNSLSPTFNNVNPTTGTKKFGTGSLRFNGSGTVTVTDPTLILGNSDFTIEFWLMVDSLELKGIFNIGNPSDHTEYNIGMYYHASGALTAQFRSTPNTLGQFSTGTSSSTISANTWHHIALVRYNNTFTLYLDGSSVGSDDITGTTAGWDQLELGTHWGTSGGDDYRFTGRIDDFRMSKKAVYTGNFTPPTSAHSTSYTSTTGDGGMVWIKDRLTTRDHMLNDTERGADKSLSTNRTGTADVNYGAVTSFNSNGFTIGAESAVNASGTDLTSWTFRKAPKFFTCLTYSGNGSTQTISHDLGSDVGMLIIKSTSAGNWFVWHRSLGDDAYLFLNGTNAEQNPGFDWIGVTSTTISLQNNSSNNNGETYIAYLFAHNDGDGDFGPDGDADIIKCGSYTGGTAPISVDLGFEPQWILIKGAVGSTQNWVLFDTMRGIATGGADEFLSPNTSDSETTFSTDYIDVTSTGFEIKQSNNAFVSQSSATYIYIAIRRGPMAVPTDATEVFDVTTSVSASSKVTTSFAVDATLVTPRDGGRTYSNSLLPRLTSPNFLLTHATDAEQTGGQASVEFDYNDGFLTGSSGHFGVSSAAMWKRAPSFFDVVAYTGNGTAGRTVSHNLGVAPEMMWVKSRTGGATTPEWSVYHKDLGNDKRLVLNTTAAVSGSSATFWYSTTPTETEFYTGSLYVNQSGYNYIAYLFASLDGVSKVGSFTGNGSTLNVDCGFSSGARFVIIKKDSGPWRVFDTERGIVSGNDPFVLLNNTDAEATTYDLLDPYSSGFTVNYNSDNGFNTNGDKFYFYAIA